MRALRLHDKLRETQALEPSSDPEEILDEVRAEKVEAILLVGHEPHLGPSSDAWWRAGPGLEIPMRKAAVARLSWAGSGVGDAARPPALESRSLGSARATEPPPAPDAPTARYPL